MLRINMPDGTLEVFEKETEYINKISEFVRNHIYRTAMTKNNVHNQGRSTEALYHILSEMFDDEINTKILNTFKDYAFVIAQNSILHYVNIVFKKISTEVNAITERYIEMNDGTSKVVSLKESSEVLYMEVEETRQYCLYGQDGVLIKQVDEIGLDEMIVYVIQCNPENLVVYDEGNKLDLEMIICLKQYLKDKVVFVNEPYPIYQD